MIFVFNVNNIITFVLIFGWNCAPLGMRVSIIVSTKPLHLCPEMHAAPKITNFRENTFLGPF